ncbi:MAG: NAD-dependent epimerase/dehydratase family protein [Deltaproteobacteria bacterium]|jgi:dihydroflavonol-4-reductase|nr:NAD-dependent epimerase/dehydratase family protein [Deltaproteobacteria bacterium]
MKFQKILVTGAGGLIGSHICRMLQRSDCSIRALLWDTESDENIRELDNIEVIRGDIRDPSLTKSSLSGCDACIHTAALNKLWHKPSKEFYETNVLGTKNICEAAFSNKIKKLVYTSSCEVMGPSPNERQRDENTRLIEESVRGHYERSKFKAEEIIRGFIKSGLPAVILRPTAVIGSHDINLTPPGRLIRSFLSGEVVVYYDSGVNVVDASDVAKAHISALNGSKTGSTYIVGGHNIMFEDLFKIMSSLSGIKSPHTKLKFSTALISVGLLGIRAFITRKDPGVTISGIKTIRHPWFFDSSKAQRELGLTPKPLKDILKCAIDWHKTRINS